MSQYPRGKRTLTSRDLDQHWYDMLVQSEDAGLANRPMKPPALSALLSPSRTCCIAVQPTPSHTVAPRNGRRPHSAHLPAHAIQPLPLQVGSRFMPVYGLLQQSSRDDYFHHSSTRNSYPTFCIFSSFHPLMAPKFFKNDSAIGSLAMNLLFIL